MLGRSQRIEHHGISFIGPSLARFLRSDGRKDLSILKSLSIARTGTYDESYTGIEPMTSCAPRLVSSFIRIKELVELISATVDIVDCGAIMHHDKLERLTICPVRI